MYRKKFLSKLVIASALVGGMNFAPIILNFSAGNLQVVSIAYAEIKDVTAKDAAILDFADESAEYTAKVQNVAKMRAIQRVRERAGVYLKSFSRTLNGVLTADDISAYTSDKIEISNVKFQKLFYQVKDMNGNLTGKIGFMYEATVTAKIDTTGLQEYIQKSLQEKQRLIERDKNLQNNIEEVNKEYEDLRQNAQNKTPEQIKFELDQINKKIEETEKTPAIQHSDKFINHQSSIIFYQPVEIGWVLRESGIGTIAGGYSKIIGKKLANGRYLDGTITFGEGNDTVDCRFDRFHPADFYFGSDSNTILINSYKRKTIFKIQSNIEKTLYLISHGESLNSGYGYEVIGKDNNGKWQPYLRVYKDERYTKGRNRIVKNFRCDGDMIIIDVIEYVNNITMKKIYKKCYKWNEEKQWFDYEEVMY